MADGDRLHPSLPLRYQQPFRQLCEGFVQLDEQARSLAERVKRDLEKCHPHLASTFRAVAQRLAALSESARAQTEQIDPRAEIQKLRTLAAMCPRRRDGALLVEAAQAIVNDIAQGQIPAQPEEVLGCKFTERLYQANFGDVVLLPPTPNIGLEAPSKEDLAQIQSIIKPNLDALGRQFSQITEDEKLRLRLQPRPKAAPKIDDLDIDITEVFNKD